MTLQWGLIALLFLTIIVLRYFDYHLYSMVSIMVTLLVFLYIKLKSRFIFEYENSGEVLSIKSYKWPFKGKRNPIFEMPQKKILDVKIKDGFFQKYLVILFSSSTGRVLKMDIDITFCSADQVNLLFGDITKNMGGKKTELISENG